jgi:hypothetical protein
MNKKIDYAARDRTIDEVLKSAMEFLRRSLVAGVC